MNLFSPKPPWYVTGLAFECMQCGRCCAGPEEGYVWLDDAEAAAIARFLGITVSEMQGRYLRRVGRRYSIVEDGGNRDCVFLQPLLPGAGGASGRGCAIYPVRPTQCRTWPFWQINLLDPQAWAHAAARCAGMNRGAFFAFDEIESRRRLTRE